MNKVSERFLGVLGGAMFIVIGVLSFLGLMLLGMILSFIEKEKSTTDADTFFQMGMEGFGVAIAIILGFIGFISIILGVIGIIIAVRTKNRRKGAGAFFLISAGICGVFAVGLVQVLMLLIPLVWNGNTKLDKFLEGYLVLNRTVISKCTV
ncbi:hypothetical protein NSQ26_14145 [Bacillus sp. FSL W7-1360]